MGLGTVGSALSPGVSVTTDRGVGHPDGDPDGVKDSEPMDRSSFSPSNPVLVRAFQASQALSLGSTECKLRVTTELRDLGREAEGLSSQEPWAAETRGPGVQRPQRKRSPETDRPDQGAGAPVAGGGRRRGTEQPSRADATEGSWRRPVLGSPVLHGPSCRGASVFLISPRIPLAGSDLAVSLLLTCISCSRHRGLGPAQESEAPFCRGGAWKWERAP